MALEDVAIIGIGVETSGVEKGKKSLETLAAAGAKAENAMGKVGASIVGASQGATTLGGAAGKAAVEMGKVGKATEAAATAQQKAGQAFTESARGLTALGGALAGALSVSAFIKAADSATILNNQLKLATGSAQAASAAYEGLFQIAQRSRVSFTELGSTFAAISRAGQELGISQQRLLGITEAIGNAMTISGGSAEGMKAALVQLGQGLASGTLRGEELNSVMEQTPRLARALADGLGVSIGQLRKLGEQGALTSEVVIQALQTQQAKLADEVKNSAATVAQAFTQLQNAAIAAVGDLDKASGSTGALATGIQAVASTIGDLRVAFAGVSDAGTDFKAFGDGVAATIRTVVLGAVTSVAALQNLGKAAAGLAAAGAQLATGGGFAGARAAMQASTEDIDENTKRWMANANAILGSAGASQRAADLNATATARMSRQGGEVERVTKLLVSGSEKGKKATDSWLESQRASAKEWERTVAAFQSMARASNDDALGLTKAESALKAYLESAAYLEDVAKGRQNEVIAAAALALENERLVATNKALEVSEKALAEAEQERIDAAMKSAQSVSERLQALQTEEQAVAIAAAQNITLAQAIEEVEIARLRERQASLMQEGGRPAEVWAIQQEIEARRQLKDAIGSKEAREAGTKSAKDAADAWQKASDQIERDITDALMRGFESGKGFAEVLRDTVANMFKTLVLRPVIQATVQGGLSAIGLGGPGAASGGSLLGTASNAYSMYSNLASGAVGAGIFGSSAAYASGLGLSTAAAGSQAAMLAAQTGSFGAAGLAATAQAAGTASTAAASAASAATSAASTLAAAAPYIAAVVAIAALAKSLDDSGTPHTGGYGSYSAASGATMGAALRDAPGSPFGLSDDAITRAGNDAAVAMAQAVVGMLDSTANTFGQNAGYAAATAFADDTSKDGAWGALSIKLGDKMLLNWADTQTSRWAPKEFSNGEAGAKEYAAAVALDVRNLLMQQTPEWADTMLQALGDAPSLDALAATVGQINAAASAFEAMGKASSAFAGLTDAATSALVQAMGGIDAAVAGLSGYYGNFYTESERAALATTALTGQLAELGKEMPASREAFRGLVDAAIAAGDSTLAAGLINLQDEFAALVPAAEAAATAVAKAKEQALAKANEQALASQSADRKAELAARRAAEAQAAEAMAETLRVYQEGAESFNTLRQSLLLAGDAAGLLAATTERAFANPNGQYTAGGKQYGAPQWTEGTTAAQFNAAYGAMTARLRRDMSDDLSANALRVQNVGPALQSMSVSNMLDANNSVTGPVYLGIRDAIVQAAGDASFAVRDAVDGAALVAAQAQVRGSFGASGPGLASVYSAMAQPQVIMDSARAYSDAVGKLNGAMRSGAISTEQFGKAMEALQQVIPNPGSDADIAAAVQGAQYAIGRAGFDSIKFYFGELGKLSTELAAAAAEAVEPIATMSAGIGRLNSFATAFGVSAQAAMSLPSASIAGSGLSLEYAAGTIGTSALISQAAAIASSVLTTADAAAAAKRLAETTAFTDTSAVGLRNAGLLLDGIRQNDAASFENAFIRITDSFAKGNLTGDQFTEVFADALTSFQGVDEETQALTRSMETLRDAMGGFADQLLIDSQRTTLTAGQTLAEMQRQYAVAYTSAMTGDAQATSQFQSLGTSLLSKNLYTSQSDYNDAFGKVVGDAQRLEVFATNTLNANANQQNAVVSELREMNSALNNRVESLEKNLTAALAVIARNTAKTSQGIDQINVTGVTTVPA